LAWSELDLAVLNARGLSKSYAALAVLRGLLSAGLSAGAVITLGVLGIVCGIGAAALLCVVFLHVSGGRCPL
jgi:hypothetical protein